MAAVASRFILMRRFETLCVRNLTLGLKTGQIPWLKSVPKAFQTQVLALVVGCVANEFALPLVRTHFYVTDTELSTNRVVFYAKDVWRAAAKASMEGLAGSQHSQVRVPDKFVNAVRLILPFFYLFISLRAR